MICEFLTQQPTIIKDYIPKKIIIIFSLFLILIIDIIYLGYDESEMLRKRIRIESIFDFE